MRHALAITLIGCGLMVLSSEAFAGGRHRIFSHSYVTPGGYGSSYGTSYGYSYGAAPSTGFGTSFGYAPQGYGTSFGYAPQHYGTSFGYAPQGFGTSSGYAPYGYGATRGFGVAPTYGMTPNFGASPGFGSGPGFGNGGDQFGGPLQVLEWMKIIKEIRDGLAPLPAESPAAPAPASPDTEKRLAKVEESITRIEGKVDDILLALEDEEKPEKKKKKKRTSTAAEVDKSSPDTFGAGKNAPSKTEGRFQKRESKDAEIMRKLDWLIDKESKRK
jgi:hypothetical protein